MPILTPDKRYIVVRDRLWRASNPGLSPSERERHTRELMSARRAIRDALKCDDKSAARLARRRVHTAKVALGERGPVWWSDGEPDLNHKIENTRYNEFWQSITTIRRTILGLLDQRASAGTICPSEVARELDSKSWRALMPRVRDVARELAREGEVEITQKGERLPLDKEWRGPIRIRLPADRRR